MWGEVAEHVAAAAVDVQVVAHAGISLNLDRADVSGDPIFSLSYLTTSVESVAAACGAAVTAKPTSATAIGITKFNLVGTK